VIRIGVPVFGSVVSVTSGLPPTLYVVVTVRARVFSVASDGFVNAGYATDVTRPPGVVICNLVHDRRDHTSAVRIGFRRRAQPARLVRRHPRTPRARGAGFGLGVVGVRHGCGLGAATRLGDRIAPSVPPRRQRRGQLPQELIWCSLRFEGGRGRELEPYRVDHRLGQRPDDRVGVGVLRRDRITRPGGVHRRGDR